MARTAALIRIIPNPMLNRQSYSLVIPRLLYLLPTHFRDGEGLLTRDEEICTVVYAAKS